MATETINIPDAIAVRILDAFAAAYQRPDKIQNPTFDSTKPEDPTTNPREILNPVSKRQFFHQQLLRYIKDVVKGHETEVGVKNARSLVETSVDTDIDLS